MDVAMDFMEHGERGTYLFFLLFISFSLYRDEIKLNKITISFAKKK